MFDNFYLVAPVDWSILHLLIPLLIIQRLWELRLAKRNEAKLRRRGAVEVGADHYPVIVTLHTLWFAGMLAEILLIPREISPFWLPLLLIFLLAQVLRWWAIRTLGDRWSTRILVLPGTKAITAGPYRRLKHPNYVAVVLELLVFPMIFGAYVTGLAVFILNLILLRIRIGTEERALREIGR